MPSIKINEIDNSNIIEQAGIAISSDVDILKGKVNTLDARVDRLNISLRKNVYSRLDSFKLDIDKMEQDRLKFNKDLINKLILINGIEIGAIIALLILSFIK